MDLLTELHNLRDDIMGKIRNIAEKSNNAVSEEEQLLFEAKGETLAEILIELNKICFKKTILSYEEYCTINNLENNDKSKDNYDSYIRVTDIKKAIKDFIDNDEYKIALRTLVHLHNVVKNKKI